MVVSYTVAGDDVVQAGLAAITDRVTDLSPFWREVFAPRYLTQVQDLFALEGQARAANGQFGGGHWAPLSPVYAAWKARHFPDATILERTGRLRQSLTWDGADIGPGGTFVAASTFVVIGTDVPYGVYHQRGTARMPARPFLPVPSAEEFAPVLKSWILGTLAEDADAAA